MFISKSKHPIARFVSLTTKHFLWLREEAWDDALMQYYTQTPLSLHATSYLKTVAGRSSQSRAPLHVGRWILTDLERQPLCQVTAQGFIQNFITFLVTVGPFDVEAASQISLNEALSLLISSVFLVGKADIIHLDDVNDLTDRVDWGAEKTVWVVRKAWSVSKKSPLLERRQLLLNRHEWWQREEAQADHQTLNYLVVREQRRATRR